MSDGSSDVCSSDLSLAQAGKRCQRNPRASSEAFQNKRFFNECPRAGKWRSSMDSGGFRRSQGGGPKGKRTAGVSVGRGSRGAFRRDATGADKRVVGKVCVSGVSERWGPQVK